MQNASLNLDHWPDIVGLDLDVSVRTHKALLRKRGVRSAADLLHLALLYGPGRLSLRSVASHAIEAGIAVWIGVQVGPRPGYGTVQRLGGL
jgi:uncharacterized membrane protein